MRAGNEEASHAEAREQTLGEPDKAVVALTVAAAAGRDADQERAECDQHRPGDDEGPVVPCVEEATDDGGQGQHGEGLRRADQVEEKDVLSWQEVLHVIGGVRAVRIDYAPAVEHTTVLLSAEAHARRDGLHRSIDRRLRRWNTHSKKPPNRQR